MIWKKKVSEEHEEIIDVLNGQKKQRETVAEIQASSNELLDDAISSSEALILDAGYKLPEKKKARHLKLVKSGSQEFQVISWQSLVEEARSQSGHGEIQNLLTEEEILRITSRVNQLSKDFTNINKLDKLDWAIAGCAGTIASLVDVFMITIQGFTGSKSATESAGCLSTWINEKIKSCIPASEISKLEKENWVPYDASNKSFLNIPVDGILPTMHRFQSLGHDPLLGFFFGVRDIREGTFTALDKHGKYIRQAVEIKDQNLIGMGMFDAIIRQLGHLKSDIATPAGLPAPLTPLLQMVDLGNFGEQNYSLGELIRQMYSSGYDFKHFLVMSVPVMIIEVLVRICYFAKSMLIDKKSFKDSIPLDVGGLFVRRKPKLNTMLFTAHLIASATNAGKVYFTGNPMAFNYPQWLALAPYLVREFKWWLIDEKKEREKYIRENLAGDWELLDAQLKETWQEHLENPILLE